MLTRRSILLTSIAAGIAMQNRNAVATPSQPATPVNFDVPAGSCDCHTHIHADPAKFPFFSGRVYTPEPASPEEMRALHKALHIDRVVIVTPSVYGTDNSATLFGMKARGATARGVAVIDEKTPEGDLDAMNQAGIRGIRLNLATGGVNDPSVGRPRFQAATERVKNRNWHVQLYTNLPMISAIKDSRRHFAGAGRVRPFRRRAGRAWCRAARLFGFARTGEVRQSVCKNLGRLPSLQARTRLSRRGPACKGADRGKFRPHHLGNRLAAS